VCTAHFDYRETLQHEVVGQRGWDVVGLPHVVAVKPHTVNFPAGLLDDSHQHYLIGSKLRACSACSVVLLGVGEDRMREGRIQRNDLRPGRVDHHSSVVVAKFHDVAHMQVRQIDAVHHEGDLLRESNTQLGHVS
jgi:hypothetical protein